jgi:hypothetical protein
VKPVFWHHYEIMADSEKEHAMGDKGGKKDKAKSQKQKTKKQQEKVKGNLEKQQQKPGSLGLP